MAQQHMQKKNLFGAKEKWCPEFPGTKGAVDGSSENRERNGEKATITEHLFDPSPNNFIP